MKMLVFALIIIGGYLSYVFIVGGVQAAYTICLDLAQSEIESRSSESCGVRRQTMEDLASCITTVQEETNLKAYLYSPLGYKSKVDTLIKMHNAECPNSTVKNPSEGIYL